MINIIINGQTANVENIENIGFRATFGNELSDQELNVDSLVLVNESKKLILDWISSNGTFIGIPVQITYGTMTFDYYIDLSENPVFSDYSIEVQIKKRGAINGFFEVANALTFELLAARNVNFPLKNIPYVIIKDNQKELAIALSISTFSTANAIYKSTQALAYIAAEFAGSLALTPGLAISAAAKLALELAYIVVLVTALKKLLDQIRELIFPKVRYLKACSIFDLIKIGCYNIGYNFSSTFLQNYDLTLLPVPLQKTNASIFKFFENELDQSFTKGYPTSQDTTPTLGQLISAVLETFALKIKSWNNTIMIETKETFENNSTFAVVPFLNVQDSRQDSYTLNTSEANLRTYVHYQTDFSDLQTLNNFEPTDAEYGLKSTINSDADLMLLKGYKDINIPFALGTRKDDFSKIEELTLDLFQFIDAFTEGNTAALVENRIGVLVISQQFFSVSKLLKVDANGKQPVNYLNYLRASAIYNNNHKQYEIQTNGFKIYENAPVLMNFSEYEQILLSNYADVNGTKCEVLSIDYIPYSSEAIITYKLPYNYANGKITNFVINA